ncbi:double-strand break repair helicase AddA [Loktanella sp. SALINAS62]|uniref:double-strand break repair helicase AddA n=1 Tax=Loktanella sp. SALINAS62 TaxID=2706124 RepID=UPI001B8C3FDD|nr:double-strand break repair helicase AddA [Loktanella sp. SALINAS62]MBS1302432.1 double-strand break repair helicase AddA [Loktanella sp. SALINAS62]
MIRDQATQRQVTAADPHASTWLSANAGSGKTRVLTDRVARLLLEGVSPQNILCLTYTKAAAAEMQNRLFKRLGGWAMLDDTPLRDELRTLGVTQDIGDHDLNRARTLFASAIETPGGLKIQTIHSFCASILRRFPLEAGVSPDFREIDDRSAALMRADVMDALVQGDARAVVVDVLRYFTGADLDDLVKSIAQSPDAFADQPDLAALRDTLDLTPGATPDQLVADILGPDGCEIIRDLIPALRTGGVNDNKAADALSLIDLAAPCVRDLETLEAVCLTKSGANPFTAKIGKFPTKAVQTAHADLTDALNGLMEQVELARGTRLALMTLDRSVALHRFGHVFTRAYRAQKTALGVLDFDDLIAKARTLLADPLVSEWVLFRLDGGMNHLLVDEAQDTSPAQWDVIRHLTRELVSGEGARADEGRTIFVVGDVKQSIYSFQGADPLEFQRMRDHFATGLTDSDAPLAVSTLEHSFRSAPSILRVVDQTFVRDRADALGGDVRHLAFKSDMPGRVDLWPLIEPSDDDADAEGDWTEPVDEVSESHHMVRMAERVAGQIKRMIADEYLPVEIDNTGTYDHRPVRAGDFLILVQSRQGLLFPELIRACKVAGLPIAGADVLRVGAELAVKDIAAVLRFLALPEDDLSLAAALKSPLFGWSEQQLFTLAHHRPDGQFLWQTLRSDPAYQATHDVLTGLLDRADFLRPYDLIARLLVRHDGRRKLLARLGAEAEDGIDALLAQALAYERDGVPSLTGFIGWMDADDLTIKRQVDAQGDQIRVMTVHGAKGLEAPIVILPDAKERAELIRGDVLPGQPPLWKPIKADIPPAIESRLDALTDKQARERLRLLYVAMTRAEKWLIVGSAGKPGKDGTGWYDLVAEGMEHAGAALDQAGDLAIQRVCNGDWRSGTMRAATHDAMPDTPPLTLGPIPPAIRVPTLSPSQMDGAKILPGDPSNDDVDTAMMRGTLMHLLLEHLPAQPANDRRAVGQTLLASYPGADDVPTDGLVDDALALLDASHLSHVFDGTLAEVGITAALPGLDGRRINGTIDRLIVTNDTVTAVDFKTNRLVPDDPAHIPEGLLRQMGAYADALALIYPAHQIKLAILWTATATLMDVPTDAARTALSRQSVA